MIILTEDARDCTESRTHLCLDRIVTRLYLSADTGDLQVSKRALNRSYPSGPGRDRLSLGNQLRLSAADGVFGRDRTP